MSGISNALVTAKPTVSGFPTVSGYTDTLGVAALPLTPNIKYDLTFSGAAIGKIQNFLPTSTTFTFWNLKNKGAVAVSISGQSLAAGNTVYVQPGPRPAIAKIAAFKSWVPGTYFRNPLGKSTSITMPESSISVSAIKLITSLYAMDGYNGAELARNTFYSASTNTWTSKASDTSARRQTAGDTVLGKQYAIDGSHGGYKNLNHAYDPSTNTWSARAVDTSARGFAIGQTVSPKLYVVDGSRRTRASRSRA